MIAWSVTELHTLNKLLCLWHVGVPVRGVWGAGTTGHSAFTITCMDMPPLRVTVILLAARASAHYRCSQYSTVYRQWIIYLSLIKKALMVLDP